MHRDIKPSNILVNNNLLVKLYDLGLSKCEDLRPDRKSSQFGVVKGTSIYMSACTLTELYQEKIVWDITDVKNFNLVAHLTKIFNARKVPDLHAVPLNVKDVLINCFSYNPIERP